MNKLTNFLTVLVAFLAMLHANGSTAAAEQFSDGAAPVEVVVRRRIRGARIRRRSQLG